METWLGFYLISVLVIFWLCVHISYKYVELEPEDWSLFEWLFVIAISIVSPIGLFLTLHAIYKEHN